MRAIRAVARGEAFVYPDALRLLLARYPQGRNGRNGKGTGTGGRAQPLSEREQAVLRLTVEGYSNHEIADRLAISTKTVDTYRQRIMEKLDLHHRTELVHYALDHGLLKPDQ
jgi:DNA-binding NarL/FixJ family response regulator